MVAPLFQVRYNLFILQHFLQFFQLLLSSSLYVDHLILRWLLLVIQLRIVDRGSVGL